MIYPARRLLWLTAFVLLPAGALPLLLPRGVHIFEALALTFSLIVFLDALTSASRLDGYSVETDPEIRATLNEEQAFPVRVKIASGLRLPASLRIALLLPDEIGTVRDDICIRPLSTSFSVEMKLKGTTRGVFRMRQAFLGAPSVIGLWELRRTLPVVTKILVQPSLKKGIRQAALLLAAHRHSDQRMVARSGRGREFDHLREFTPGDEVSQVDWKATARRRTPTVRQYRVERTQDIYVCIDASRYSTQAITKASGQRVTLLDEYVASTIMLARLIGETGDRFGLMTFSNRVHHFLRASSGLMIQRTLSSALYPLQANLAAPAFDEVCATLRAQVRRRSLFVFLTHLSQPQLAESFLKAVSPLARQHLVIAACPSDAHTKSLFQEVNAGEGEDMYGSLAGHLFWKRLQETRSRLAKANVRMSCVAPEGLGLFAASAYLDVKERQLL